MKAALTPFEKFFTRPAAAHGSSKHGPLRHGQFSPDKTKRFWAYHETGKEMWVTTSRFNKANKKTAK